MESAGLLQGAWDLHVHAAPDLAPRVQTCAEVAANAASAGMAGVLFKDHCTSTVGRAAALCAAHPGLTVVGSLCLNPTVGGLNPAAVEAALCAGARVIYLPTYGAAHHIGLWGRGKPPTMFPLREHEQGIHLLDGTSRLTPVLDPIFELIAAHDAVLATGHVAPAEGLAALTRAAELGVKRLLVTHASTSVTQMPLDMQRQCVEVGALVEHCFFAVTKACPGAIPLERIATEVRELGIGHVILSSDLGQVANLPPVQGFAEMLGRTMALGFSRAEMAAMVCDNPVRLLD